MTSKGPLPTAESVPNLTHECLNSHTPNSISICVSTAHCHDRQTQTDRQATTNRPHLTLHAVTWPISRDGLPRYSSEITPKSERHIDADEVKSNDKSSCEKPAGRRHWINTVDHTILQQICQRTLVPPIIPRYNNSDLEKSSRVSVYSQNCRGKCCFYTLHTKASYRLHVTLTFQCRCLQQYYLYVYLFIKCILQ